MRAIIGCSVALVVAAAGLAFSHQPPNVTGTESLIDVLATHKTFSYNRGQSGGYNLKVLNDDEIKLCRDYYAHREEREIEYMRLRDKRSVLAKEWQLQTAARIQAGEKVDISARADVKELDLQLAAVAKPMDGRSIGEFHRRGTDFVGLTSLETGRETLIPLHSIGSVIIGQEEKDPASKPPNND